MTEISNINLKPDETIYKYKLIKQIGGGVFGQVWLARDVTMDQNVAVKVLDPSTSTVAEQLKEAHIGSHLKHKNLVKVQYADVISHNYREIVVIAMDYFKNGSIVNKLNSERFLPLPDALKYLKGILAGLEYLHENNIFHGDIKPQNILLGPSNEGVLTDYGISCKSQNLSPVRLRSAYNLHIAPESIKTDQISVQTDIYQTGLTAFRLLNGIDCFQQIYDSLGKEKYYELVKQGKLEHHITYLPFIPRALKGIINKAIAVDPSNRYQNAIEMRRALERLHFPGYWTYNTDGEYEGINGNYVFRYEIFSKDGVLYDIRAYKKNINSERETRIHQYFSKQQDQKKSNAIIQKFMHYVVMTDLRI